MEESSEDNTFPITLAKHSFEESLEAVLKADQSHRFLKGSGLRIHEIRSYKLEERPESPYSNALFEGTEFSEMELVRVENIRGAPTYTDKEVYKAIGKYTRSCLDSLTISLNVRRKYPPRIWGNQLPLECINEIISHKNAFREILTEEEKEILKRDYEQQDSK